MLEETFETPSRLIYLDKGTSLFETLAQIDAGQASRPVGCCQCATLAAQVAHVTFYLEVLERYITTGQTGKVDWGEIWCTGGAVSPEEWARLNTALKDTYARVNALLRGRESWDDCAADRRGAGHRGAQRLSPGRDSAGAVHAEGGERWRRVGG